MKVEDAVSDHHAVKKAGIETSGEPILLGDNGSCYVSGELKEYLSAMRIRSIHGRVAHPQTQVR